jgi:RNA polymerase sigma-70 factor (ECF subfamily)
MGKQGDGDDLGLLVERARAGDGAAFERLVEPRLARLLLRVELRLPAWLAARTDGADLVQETLLAAHQGLARLEVRGPLAFDAWLFRLADRVVSRAVEHHATLKRGGGRTEALPPGSGVPGLWATPSSVVLGKERAERIREAVRSLPEDYRRVIVLRILDGLSVADVAKRLEKSEGSVRMLTLRALEALRTECDL